MKVTNKQKEEIYAYIKHLQRMRDEIESVVGGLFIGDILEYLRWWTDDWRFESGIHTRILKSRHWKLSESIPDEINVTNEKRKNTICAVYDALFYK